MSDNLKELQPSLCVLEQYPVLNLEGLPTVPVPPEYSTLCSTSPRVNLKLFLCLLSNKSMAVLQLIVVVLSVLATAHGTAVNPGGCTVDKCTAIGTLTPRSTDPLKGFYMGRYNPTLDITQEHSPGGPVVNFESYRVSISRTSSRNCVYSCPT